MLKLISAPKSIQKGMPLKTLLGADALDCLAHNLQFVFPAFNSQGFIDEALPKLESLELKARAYCIADAMKAYLPEKYSDAIDIILRSLTPPNLDTKDLGLAVMFYQPHGCFVERYGLDAKYNSGEDPFDVSMQAQYEITRRFTAEFSIRPFIIQQQARTLKVLEQWLTDKDPHVRRLCSEGTRPRLPWAPRLPAFIEDPSPILPILNKLKNDEELYVRRSVANSLGDIAKDHPELVFGLCEDWLTAASKELKWLIRHALRHPFKKGVRRAIELRAAAK